jgi:hypothetical protein
MPIGSAVDGSPIDETFAGSAGTSLPWFGLEPSLQATKTSTPRTQAGPAADGLHESVLDISILRRRHPPTRSLDV